MPRTRLLIGVVVGVMALVDPRVGQAVWPGRVIDTHVEFDVEPDLAFDSTGALLIGYHASGLSVRLARVSCQSVERTTVHDQGGLTPAVAVDGWGAVSVVDYSLGPAGPGIYYSWMSSPPAFETMLITGSEHGVGPDYAVDSLGRPHVAFANRYRVPSHASFSIQAGDWVVETLPGIETVDALGGHKIAMTVDGQDRPVVAYATEQGNIVVATMSPGGWWSTRTYPLSGGEFVHGVSVVTDSVNAPVVAYTTPTGLHYLRFHTLGVNHQTVMAGWPIWSGAHAMAIDGAGRVRIAFMAGPESTLWLARNDMGWTTTELPVSRVCPSPAIELDSTGRWVIAYQDSRSQRLKIIGTAAMVGKPADFDRDGDVDGDDHTLFEACATAPHVTQTDPDCLNADFDEDDDVDQDDFGVFQRCYSGAGEDSDAACAD